MDQEGSHEPQPKQKEVVPQETLRNIFEGCSAVILVLQGEPHELPAVPGAESTPHAFHLPLDKGMVGLALQLDQDTESVESAEVIYSEEHLAPELSEEAIPPELIMDVHVRTFLTLADGVGAEDAATVELDKHIIYRVQHLQGGTYNGDTSIEYHDPRMDIEAQPEVPEETSIDIGLLQLETLLHTAEDLASHDNPTAAEIMQMVTAHMSTHDLTPDEAAHLQAILHALTT